MWEDCKVHPDECPYYHDLETREMIQGTVDGFMSYLNDKRAANPKTKNKPS